MMIYMLAAAMTVAMLIATAFSTAPGSRNARASSSSASPSDSFGPR